VTEAGIQLGIARARSGATIGRQRGITAPPVDVIAVQGALAKVADPELPVVSIVDLGMIGDVLVDPETGAVTVELLPTFVGCPAIEAIKGAIADRLTTLDVPVRIETTFRIPWTSDRITDAGRAALATVGIAGPSAPDLVRCPYCASDRVVLDSAFGPTQCRSLYYCRACRQPFEAIKSV
jgi:ring-1,2-phenylacetyl-CoA epoxidase subunit PaaD